MNHRVRLKRDFCGSAQGIKATEPPPKPSRHRFGNRLHVKLAVVAAADALQGQRAFVVWSDDSPWGESRREIVGEGYFDDGVALGHIGDTGALAAQ